MIKAVGIIAAINCSGFDRRGVGMPIFGHDLCGRAMIISALDRENICATCLGVYASRMRRDLPSPK